MRLLQNKRAQEEQLLGTTIEFVLLLIIAGLIILVIAREYSSTKYEKMFLASDIGMFVDTVYSAPNNIIISYPQNTYDFSYRFETGKVTVYKESETIAFGESSAFTEENNVKFIYKTLPPAGSNIEFVGDDDAKGIPLIFVRSRAKMEPVSGILVDTTK